MEDRGAIDTSCLEGASDQWVHFAIAGPLDNLINVRATGATSHFEPALAARKDTKNGFGVRSEDTANLRHCLVLRTRLRKKPRLPLLNHRFHASKTTKIALLPFPPSASVLRRTTH